MRRSVSSVATPLGIVSSIVSIDGGAGGGLYVNDYASLTGGYFDYNIAENGGAIYNDSSLYVSLTRFYGNGAYRGAGA